MMTPNQAAAFVIAQAAMMNARIAGMVAENQCRERRGDSPAFGEAEFAAVEQEYGGTLGHNAVIEIFRSANS